MEVSYHTPTNCDVCIKTLPWSLNIMRRGEYSYECQRETAMPVVNYLTTSNSLFSLHAGCHLRSHKEHTERDVEAMQPCVGGEQNIKRLLLLIKDRYFMMQDTIPPPLHSLSLPSFLPPVKSWRVGMDSYLVSLSLQDLLTQ